MFVAIQGLWLMLTSLTSNYMSLRHQRAAAWLHSLHQAPCGYDSVTVDMCFCVCCLPQGVFIPSQVAAASTLLGSAANLQAVLCQFFREDLISWTSRKGKGAGGASLHLPNDTLKGLVARNTHQVGAGRGWVHRE